MQPLTKANYSLSPWQTRSSFILPALTQGLNHSTVQPHQGDFIRKLLTKRFGHPNTTQTTAVQPSTMTLELELCCSFQCLYLWAEAMHTHVHMHTRASTYSHHLLQTLQRVLMAIDVSIGIRKKKTLLLHLGSVFSWRLWMLSLAPYQI